MAMIGTNAAVDASNCLDKDLAAAQATVDAIVREGGSATALACDVTDACDVRNAIEAHVSRVGRIDVLHDNIGIVEMGGPVECSEDSGWDIGEASVFLASDAARFITGQVLTVDGGSTICMPLTFPDPLSATAPA